MKQEKGPRILLNAIALIGTKEFVGKKHNITIINWAKEIGGWIGKYYDRDEIPWCGLFVGICAARANFAFNQKMLSAKSWLEWGTEQKTAMLGDVLVFNRKGGGGHVGFYVGEDKECYHVLGGNQNNEVNVTRIDKKRLLGVRRCTWRVMQPTNVRVVHLEPEGTISTNEE